SEPRPWRAEPPEDEREQHRADEGRRRSEDHVVRAAQDVEPAGSYIFEEYSDLVVDLLHRPSAIEQRYGDEHRAGYEPEQPRPRQSDASRSQQAMSLRPLALSRPTNKRGGSVSEPPLFWCYSERVSRRCQVWCAATYALGGSRR